MNILEEQEEVRHSTTGISVFTQGSYMSSSYIYQSIKRRKGLGTDQSPTGVRPVEFDAHIELGAGSAAEHQPLPHRQSLL